MHGIYERLGLTVASVGQSSTAAERTAAYAADITYATANEVGFDYLRDGLALDPAQCVHRPFASAVIDEADSILIDEARIPLVIAGGSDDGPDLAVAADRTVRGLMPLRHFRIETTGLNIVLTPLGVTAVERGMGVENLFDAESLEAHTAVQDALHAYVLLRRDVDYVVSQDAVVPVDELKGRLVPERRWPAGLQTALECKEGVQRRRQGRVLGSITVEHLIGQYPRVAGMTGTAATQIDEFREIYGLPVVSIPTHKAVARVDQGDRTFATKAEKEAAVFGEIRRVHESGRPVLVGTSSVEESERLSRALRGLPHHVLNARNEEAEAAIVARAGEPGAVTISTNMAGRGVDIRLGAGVAERGGLHVIGTNRHDSRRIDHQLRGRAGRQGDPGSSQFFVSREDPIFVRHAEGDAEVSADQVQRMAEGQNLDIRLFLRKYERVLEGQRLAMRARRDGVLCDRAMAARTRQITLATLDDLWADYLAAIAELRAGTPWLSLGGKDPLRSFLTEVHGMYEELGRTIEEETAARLEQQPPAADAIVRDRGATWTYLTTDEPFGPMSQRIMRNLVGHIRAMRARQRTQ
jgi:preprotein translocase subunit SecA